MLLHDTRIADTGTLNYAQPRWDEKPDTYPPGRRCIEHGCITILHQYHEGPWCHAHEDKHQIELLAIREQGDIEEIIHGQPLPLHQQHAGLAIAGI